MKDANGKVVERVSSSSASGNRGGNLRRRPEELENQARDKAASLAAIVVKTVMNNPLIDKREIVLDPIVQYAVGEFQRAWVSCGGLASFTVDFETRTTHSGVTEISPSGVTTSSISINDVKAANVAKKENPVFSYTAAVGHTIIVDDPMASKSEQTAKPITSSSEVKPVRSPVTVFVRRWSKDKGNYHFDSYVMCNIEDIAIQISTAMLAYDSSAGWLFTIAFDYDDVLLYYSQCSKIQTTTYGPGDMPIDRVPISSIHLVTDYGATREVSNNTDNEYRNQIVQQIHDRVNELMGFQPEDVKVKVQDAIRQFQNDEASLKEEFSTIREHVNFARRHDHTKLHIRSEILAGVIRFDILRRKLERDPGNVTQDEAREFMLLSDTRKRLSREWKTAMIVKYDQLVENAKPAK